MANGDTITYTGKLILTSCGVCSIRFAMPEDLERRARQRGEKFSGFYCPQGHSLVYRDGENDRLKKKVQALEAKDVATQDQLRAATQEAEALRIQILRDRQRFANGVCPCCNRSFTNVRRHMASQHPDYDVSRVDVEGVRFRCECGRSFESLRGLRTHQGHRRSDDWATSKRSWGRHLTKV